MRHHFIQIFTFGLLICKGSVAQQPELIQKELTKSAFFYNEEQEIFTSSGFVYYTSYSALGYYVEKFDHNLNLKKSLMHKFETDDVNVEFVKPILLKDELYLVTGSFDKKEKVSELKISKLNEVSLEMEEAKLLFVALGKLNLPDMETQTRAFISQSESKNYWSISVFIGKDYVEQAEFIVAAFDANCTELYQERFQVDYLNYAFMQPYTKTDEVGNVYITSRMVFKHVQNSGEQFRHIFCVTEKGKNLKIIDFDNKADFYQFSCSIEPLKDEKLFAYLITNKGMMTCLIDAKTGKILKEQLIDIDLNTWKNSAWYTDNKLTPVGMFFLPKLVKQDSKGNIYIVGEQGVSDAVNNQAYADNYSVLVVKYNSAMEQEWYKIIPKLQSSVPPYTVYQGIQATLENDSLDLFLNYSLSMFSLKLYEDGKVDRKELMAQMPDTKVNMKADSIGTTDVIQIRLNPDGDISYYKVMDNTVKMMGFGATDNSEKLNFLVGTVEGTSSEYYFIASGICTVGLTNYASCKKSICCARW